MNSFNVDRVVKYVKCIADNNQCATCGQLKGLRVRYPCGHSVCQNCVLTAENCVLCLSPQDVFTHVNDGPLNLRVKNATNLLHTFQELYKLDVYRRLRVSEQLQLEKQLFPECIQAPSKYFNNRRSSNKSLIINKENIQPLVLPGENISKSEMENKINYVQQWLNKNETSQSETNYNLPRTPFTDISVNGQNVLRPKTLNKVYRNRKVLSRNKSHIKTFNTDLKDKSKLSLKRIRNNIKLKECKEVVNYNHIKCDKNESGIVIEDETLIINDTESLDKDKNAWLAVIEAEKKHPCDDFSNPKSSKIHLQIPSQHAGKVPFYRKGSLWVKSLNNQFDEMKNNKEQHLSKTNNATITIDNNCFVTTIKIYEDQDIARDRTKISIGVQTENRNNFKSNSGNFAKDVESSNGNIKHEKIHKIAGSSKNFDAISACLAKEVTPMEANQKHTDQSVKETKCLIIDDSDSDSDILLTEMDSLLEVTAEVHQPENEYNCSVLSQLEQGEYEHRMRHEGRGNTPASTDSSDKENYDPNRVKRRKLDKKCCSKKY